MKKFSMILILCLLFNQIITYSQSSEDPISMPDSILMHILEQIESNRNPKFVLGLVSDSLAIDLCENDSLKSRVYYHLGRAYGQMGNFEKSLQALELGSSVSKKLPDSQIGILMAQGNIYWAKDYYQTALETYQAALDLANQFQSDQYNVFQVMLLSNISGIYKKLKNNDNAFSFAEKSIKLAYQTGNLRPRGHLKIGTMLNDLGQYERALDSLQVTETMIYQHNDSIALVHCLLAKATAFHHLGKIDSAMYYTEYSSNIADRLNYEFIDIQEQRGDLYLIEGKMNQALKEYQGALRAAQKQKSIESQQSINERLSEFYVGQKNFQEAHKYLEYSVALKDSISSTSIQNRINELNTKYETEKKEQQIFQLESEKKIQNLQAERDEQAQLVLIIVATALIVIALLFYLRFKNKARANQLLDTKNQELAKLNQTKNRLFSIISHDLKSPLSSFHTITKNLLDNWDAMEKVQLKDFVITLRDSSADVKNMMDNLLKWALTQTDQLSYRPSNVDIKQVLNKVIDELSTVSSLKNIKVNLIIKGHGNIQADKDFVQIVIRNLLSNALKFSAMNNEIDLTIEETEPIISIKDYGVGMDQAQIEQLFCGDIVAQDIQNSTEKGTGLGLVLCKELMERMNGKIEAKSKKGEGTTFTLIFKKT